MVVIEDITEDDNSSKSAKSPTQRRDGNAIGSGPPAGPSVPEIKMSMVLPLLAMLSLQKVDIENSGYVPSLEKCFIAVHLLSCVVLYVTYTRISNAENDGGKVYVQEEVQFGQVVSEAKEMTTKEYDMSQLWEIAKQPLIGCVIIGGIYIRWGLMWLLVVQLVATPTQLFEAPVMQIYIFGLVKNRPRPFPGASAIFATSPQVAAEPMQQKRKKGK